MSAEGQRQVALLNQQTAQLREQLDALQGLLDTAEAKDVAAQVQIDTLGSEPQRGAGAGGDRGAAAGGARGGGEGAAGGGGAGPRRATARSSSGRMRDILGEREGVQVVGDRFVFPSEVLFAPGSATLGRRRAGAGGAGGRR